MNVQDFLDEFMRFEPGLNWRSVVLAMLASFVLSQLCAAIYVWTYRGLSYSRGFVQALVMTGLVATMLMLAIGNNVARGLGLMGTLALIRYRATLRDARDMAFVFAVLAVGITCGVQAYVVGVVGVTMFCALSLWVARSSFGSRRDFDGLVRYQSAPDPTADLHCKRVLKQYCSNFILVNMRELAQGRVLEHAYQVRLRDPSFNEALVMALRAIPHVDGVAMLMQEQTVEV